MIWYQWLALFYFISGAYFSIAFVEDSMHIWTADKLMFIGLVITFFMIGPLLFVGKLIQGINIIYSKFKK